MAHQGHRGRQGRGYYRSSSQRYSRSPDRDDSRRPLEETRRSAPSARREILDRRGGPYPRDHVLNEGSDRGRQPTVDLLPGDHPLIREIRELRRVRWNRLQDWIRLAQRLGRDWHHPDSLDFREFREEERLATDQLERLAGAIALAERSLPFDREPDRRREPDNRRERPLPRRPAPLVRKRKLEDDTQVWTDKKSESKVQDWMRSNKAKSLENEKPVVPVLIGSSDTDEDLFLPDETDAEQNQATNDHLKDHNGGSKTVQRADVVRPIEPAKLSIDDSFSSTRDRADEFLQDLAPEVPAKANAKLPPPPIVPIPDVLEQWPGKRDQLSSMEEAGCALEQLITTDSNVETASNEPTTSTGEEFDLAAYLRWLNTGKAPPNSIQKPTQQPSTASAAEVSTPPNETRVRENTQAVKQEPVGIKELLRALKPHGGS